MAISNSNRKAPGDVITQPPRNQPLIYRETVSCEFSRSPQHNPSRCPQVQRGPLNSLSEEVKICQDFVGEGG